MLGQVARAALVDPMRPLLAQIVVTERCNLACAYCTEHRPRARPVPFEVLLERFDHLRRLRCVFVTLNGGEPLLHPQVAELVAAIRTRGMTPLMNTNGLCLTRDRVDALNEAGLYGMQVSLDGLHDSPVSKKSLDRLEPIFELLLKRAAFRLRVNIVLGACPPDEAVAVARWTCARGLQTQCSLMRDRRGLALPFTPEQQAAYDAIRALSGRLPPLLHDRFQLPLVRGEDAPFKCRSGSRFFHVCAQGKVHYCQPREGLPGVPLAAYGREDIARAFREQKLCARRCGHAYSHIASRLDGLRAQDLPDPEPDVEPAPQEVS